MSKFIKLTQGSDKQILYLAVDKIVAIYSFLGKTYITCVDCLEKDSTYSVNETVDEVMSMLND